LAEYLLQVAMNNKEIGMPNQGIVFARHVDHCGMTAPNLDEAIRFFEDAIGAKLLWRVGPT
jgi:Glyoxalase/Bleomycin resistance protein/Dioxygenase superfamily